VRRAMGHGKGAAAHAHIQGHQCRTSYVCLVRGSMFAQYLASYDRAMEVKEELLRAKPKFAAFVEEAARDPRCNG
jgi:hypothetical protein